MPGNRAKNTTLIASMTLEGGMGASMALEGTTDAEVFEAYVEHFLAPTLFVEGQVVVMMMTDKLPAHNRTAKARELIEAREAQLRLLPSYSPDLNPIEEAFSKIKGLVRKAGARTKEALIETLGQALSAVTLRDVEGWFRHCGYNVQDRPS